MWFSSGNTADQVVGWFDMKKWDATHDEAASQGWARSHCKEAAHVG